jgi:hypothetical protein
MSGGSQGKRTQERGTQGRKITGEEDRGGGHRGGGYRGRGPQGQGSKLFLFGPGSVGISVALLCKVFDIQIKMVLVWENSVP